MTTTDTDALKERIARAQYEAGWHLTPWEDVPAGSRAIRAQEAAAILPIVEAEVCKAKAEAWDECEATAIIEDAPCSENFLFMVTHAPNPYRESETASAQKNF